MWPNSLETMDLTTFTEEILNGKLQFLCCQFFSINSQWKSYRLSILEVFSEGGKAKVVQFYFKKRLIRAANSGVL